MLKLMMMVALLSIQFSCDKTDSRSTSSRTRSLKEGESSLNLDSSKTPSLADAGTKPTAPKPLDDLTKDEREAYKLELHKYGYYDCCITPYCSMCLFVDEECKCEHTLKTREAVCGECYKGWQKGKGSIKGVNTKNIKRL